jgi:hypothetical protein
MLNRRRTALRRHPVRTFVAIAGYLHNTLAATLRLVRDGALTGPLAWLVAQLPSICVTGVFRAHARLLLAERDEYLRMLMVRKSLVATGSTLVVATVWGFLANFGQVSQRDGLNVAILWFLGLGPGQFQNHWMGKQPREHA